jgi:glucose-6-phosphate 1-dehydrogenase
VIGRIVILGAAGDLAGRSLFPALAELRAAGRLAEDVQVVGASREDRSPESFRQWVAQRLDAHASSVDPEDRAAFVKSVDYAQADAANADDLARVVAAGRKPLLVHFALPPQVFAASLEAVAEAGLPAGSRVIVEKPFGSGLAEARRLNQLVDRTVGQDAVFRIDHFLGKQTVQNVLGLRFANRVFEPVWNAQHIERVEITWFEKVALEGRAGYYDRAGALRDMIQNHLLQLLALVAMDPPFDLDEPTLRNRKAEVLRAVRSLAPEEIGARTQRARYAAGEVDGRPIPAYADEPGVDPGRATETYAEVTLDIRTWRWAGVPFTLRTGKAIGAARREILVRFRPVPHLAFPPGEAAAPNVLRLTLNPDRMALGLTINGVGDPFDLEHVELDTTLAPQDLSAYARLLLDAVEGDFSLSIRGDEAEESWRIVEPILRGWREGRSPLAEYPAGSSGPQSPPARQAPA